MVLHALRGTNRARICCGNRGCKSTPPPRTSSLFSPCPPPCAPRSRGTRCCCWMVRIRANPERQQTHFSRRVSDPTTEKHAFYNRRATSEARHAFPFCVEGVHPCEPRAPASFFARRISDSSTRSKCSSIVRAPAQVLLHGWCVSEPKAPAHVQIRRMRDPRTKKHVFCNR